MCCSGVREDILIRVFLGGGEVVFLKGNFIDLVQTCTN